MNVLYLLNTNRKMHIFYGYLFIYVNFTDIAYSSVI